MSPVETFIRRPVATTLLTIGIALAGLIAFRQLPVSPLPSVDYPVIFVSASVPGASPEVMAATVATPLERALGRIAGVNEMTSRSSDSSTSVILQFDISRDINGAAREVQAAINNARSLLPTSLSHNPTYRKINPADAPILILALTSDSISRGQMYDVASSILAQKIAQIPGVGDVTVGGGSLPAVRIQLDPGKLAAQGVSLDAVRTAVSKMNANAAKGFVESGDMRWQIGANDQALTAKEYLPLIINYKNSAPVRLSDVGTVFDSVENVRNAANFNGKPSILIQVTRQPDANIIETVDRIKAMMPALKASIPGAIDMQVGLDRSVTIRASLHEVEATLLISVILVTMVVYLFLRDWRATMIPAVAVPVSLIGTFSVMYLLGFSLNNLSLMALTIATGFVVDDAIVVLENVARHVEAGVPRFKAAIQGAEEVAFTVISVSISLIAVFIPILLMGGLLGRLFREFAVTLAVAILVSMVISLTTTPMMCARFLKHRPGGGRKSTEDKFGDDRPQLEGGHKSYGHNGRRDFVDWMVAKYESSLRWALRYSPLIIVILIATVGLNVYLFIHIEKGFFPQQDIGQVWGGIQADQSISFNAMRQKVDQFADIVRKDPDVESVNASTGGGGPRGGSASGSMFIALKPRSQRKDTADDFVNRMRLKSSAVAGAQLFLFPAQDIHVGGRSSNAQYQYTLQADDYADLQEWEPKIRNAMAKIPQITDVNSDAQGKGLQTTLIYDREMLARLGLTVAGVNSILYDSFGQRQVSTLYKSLNQYHVIMELANQFEQGPSDLKGVYFIGPNGTEIPLSAVAKYGPTNTPLVVNHQGQFVASTNSFNLPEGVSLSQAGAAIDAAMRQIGVPSSVRGSFQGTAKAFQDAMGAMPLLILAAIVAVYIVLGILYESLVHPLTILSTLPSAGVGALLALKVFDMEFTIIALIGVLLLIGIVKKNAILMIDFAIEAERRDNLHPKEAIFQAAVLRFRPIMMTTMAALLGALPLAIGFGDGSELRQPLGISIVGGLLVSQVLTLYTTPIVYYYFDAMTTRVKSWVRRRRVKSVPAGAAPARSSA